MSIQKSRPMDERKTDAWRPWLTKISNNTTFIFYMLSKCRNHNQWTARNLGQTNCQFEFLVRITFKSNFNLPACLDETCGLLVKNHISTQYFLFLFVFSSCTIHNKLQVSRETWQAHRPTKWWLFNINALKTGLDTNVLARPTIIAFSTYA